jgi:hypothetical protein
MPAGSSANLRHSHACGNASLARDIRARVEREHGQDRARGDPRPFGAAERGGSDGATKLWVAWPFPAAGVAQWR